MGKVLKKGIRLGLGVGKIAKDKASKKLKKIIKKGSAEAGKGKLIAKKFGKETERSAFVIGKETKKAAKEVYGVTAKELKRLKKIIEEDSKPKKKVSKKHKRKKR